MSGKSDLIDVSMTKHAETAKAILVSDTGDKDDAIWLPKSQIEVDDDGHGNVTVTLPEWLATDKGLV